MRLDKKFRKSTLLSIMFLPLLAIGAATWAAASVWTPEPLIFPVAVSGASTLIKSGDFDIIVSADTLIAPTSGDWEYPDSNRVTAIGNASADTTAVIKTSGDAVLTAQSESSGDMSVTRNYAAALRNGASLRFEGKGVFIASSDIKEVYARALRNNSVGLFDMSGDITIKVRSGENSGTSMPFNQPLHNAYDGWFGSRARFSGEAARFDVELNGASGSGIDIIGNYDPETYEVPADAAPSTLSLDARENVISVKLRSLSTLGTPEAGDYYIIRGINAISTFDTYVGTDENGDAVFKTVDSAPVYVTADKPVSVDISLEGTAAASSDLCLMFGVAATGKNTIVRLNSGVSISMSECNNSDAAYAEYGGQIYIKGNETSPVRIYGAPVEANGDGSLVDLTLNAKSVFGTGADAGAKDSAVIALRTTDGAEIALPAVTLISGDLTLGAGFSGTADVLTVEGLGNNINVGSGAKFTFKSVNASANARLNINGAAADIKNIVIPQAKGLTITYNSPYVEPTKSDGSGGCSAGLYGFALLLPALSLMAIRKRSR